MHRNRITFAIISLTIPALMSGCGAGHGKHTTEGLAKAQERMGDMKAATAWDLARQQYTVGDLSKALDNIDESISYNESVPKAHTLRGKILLEMGQLEPAIEAFRTAVNIDPKFVDGHYYLGVVMERISDYESALESYETAAIIEPTNAQYVVAAAEMYVDLGQLEKAEQLLSSRRATLEHNAGIRQSLGHVALMQNKSLEAVSLFREARLLAPEDLAILEDLALAQLAAEQWAEADYSSKTLLESEGYENRRDLQRLRARCLIELDRPVEARAILLALTSSPEGGNDLHAWRDLGEAAMLVGDLQRARMASRRIIALRPELPDGYEVLAAAQIKAGDLENALGTIDLAIELAPHVSSLALVRGMVLEQLGRFDEADAAYRLAAELDPADTRAQRMLAVVEDSDED